MKILRKSMTLQKMLVNKFLTMKLNKMAQLKFRMNRHNRLVLNSKKLQVMMDLRRSLLMIKILLMSLRL